MTILQRTDVISDAELRAMLVLDDDEEFPTGDTIQTCAGEWRKEPDGRWCFWIDPDWDK